MKDKTFWIILLSIFSLLIVGFSVQKSLMGIEKGNGQALDSSTQNKAVKEIKIIPKNKEQQTEIKKQKEIQKDNYKAIPFKDAELKNISFEIQNKFENPQMFSKKYTDTKGILTFRGNHFRTSPSYGIVSMEEEKLEELWDFQTKWKGKWGGGAGWTGQPVIVKWDEEILQIMNVKEKFKKQDDFVEVIQASLDGNVYFIDLKTGEKTREPINIGNPIKGSVSVDSRGYPMLYVGEGIPENGTIGFNLFNLINQKKLYRINGIDGFANRGWGAFDGSALFNKETDSLIVAGENGILYNIKLNTNFNIENKSLTINPKTMKYKYELNGNYSQGIENSVAVYKNIAYFADNGGGVQAVDLTSMKPIWALEKFDDTDATIVIDEEDNKPVIYTGSEVDKQGVGGVAKIKKMDGLTGEILWEKDYICFFSGGKSPVNGGLLATPVVGKGDVENLVFITLSRYNKMNEGLMVALDKQNGEEVWTWNMEDYAWSSPIDIYKENRESYLVQADSVGDMHLMKSKTGEILDKINLGSNVESSPAIYNDILVVATRGGHIKAIKIK